MKIVRDNSVAPLIIIDDFLSEEAASEILAECIDLKPVYHEAGVIDYENKGTVMRKDFRRNEAVFIDRIFDKNEKRSRILKNMYSGNFRKRMRDTWREGDTCFDMINYANRFETVLSRYGDGDFYNYHVDGNGNHGQRVITAVYYVHKKPALFTGGNIHIKRDDKEMAIEPWHNRLIVFRSDTLHRVEKTVLPGNAFDWGRFSLNIWIGFK